MGEEKEERISFHASIALAVNAASPRDGHSMRLIPGKGTCDAFSNEQKTSTGMKVPSPCIGVCKFKNGGYCIGCGMRKKQKKKFKRLDGRKAKLAFIAALRLQQLDIGLKTNWERAYRRRGRSPIVRRELFGHASYRNGLLIATAYFAGMPASFLVTTLYLQEGLHEQPLAAGLVVVPFAAGSAVAAWVGGRLVNRVGRALVVGGLVTVVVGVVGLLCAAVLAFFPLLVLKKGYALHDVIVVAILSSIITAVRAWRTPLAVLLQAAGQFKELASIGTLSGALSVFATLALLLTVGPIASLGGILLGELVILARVIQMARDWKLTMGKLAHG